MSEKRTVPCQQNWSLKRTIFHSIEHPLGLAQTSYASSVTARTTNKSIRDFDIRCAVLDCDGVVSIHDDKVCKSDVGASQIETIGIKWEAVAGWRIGLNEGIFDDNLRSIYVVNPDAGNVSTSSCCSQRRYLPGNRLANLEIPDVRRSKVPVKQVRSKRSPRSVDGVGIPPCLPVP